MEGFKFYVLGSRGSRPVSGPETAEFGGATSCYILRSEGYALVLDCGTGLYSAKPYLDGCKQVDVVMTHLHYDHILGLLGWGVFPAGAQVRLYAGVPEGTPGYDIEDFLRPPFWPVCPALGRTNRVGCGNDVRLTERVSVRFAPANHPDSATVLRVDTDGGAMCLVCDWEHGGPPVPEEITRGCGFMLYDGMFQDTEYPARVGWGHSTWQEGVKIARERQIPHLIIAHHMPERTDRQLRQMEAEARQLFPSTRFARAGDVYTMKGEVAEK